jgi:hypothetical protein
MIEANPYLVVGETHNSSYGIITHTIPMALNMFVYKSCRRISSILEGLYESSEPSKALRHVLRLGLRVCGSGGLPYGACMAEQNEKQ